MTYLDNGGRMYIEGGDLGYNHAPGQAYNFGLWAYLHTQWVNDGSSNNNVNLLTGKPLWPARGLIFGYPFGTGPDSYVDEFAPLAGAKLQFEDQLDRGRVVSYTEVSRGYRTYTSAVVHGAFIEDAPLSTQDRLMERIVAELMAVDTDPPVPPGNVSAHLSGEDVVVTWDPVSQDTGGGDESVDCYKVERRIGMNGRWTPLGFVPDTEYTDTPSCLGDPESNCFYRILCLDTAGNTGQEACAGEMDYQLEIPSFPGASFR